MDNEKELSENYAQWLDLVSDRQRLIVLAMLLENLGIDKVVRFGRLEDWKAAIADLEKQRGSGDRT